MRHGVVLPVILDLFAGPGGWSEGLRLLGVTTLEVGVETDKHAVATRNAAGHVTLQRDVRDLRAADVVGLAGLIASPPCQTFSDAGKGEGMGALAQLVTAARQVLEGSPVADAVARTGLDSADPRSTLVLEPLRFITAHTPSWIVFEEVKGVLPVWKAYAHLLRDLGYTTWAGVLNAADYGLPQLRKRAFLLARHGQPIVHPQQTHADLGEQDTYLALPEADGIEPWITMAEALDLGPEPDDDTAWAWHRPATTVVRSFRPEVVAAPGYRTVGDPSRQNAPGSIVCTPEQLCVLQGIREDYPFAGSESKRLSLIGAVLPPPWAAAILEPLIGEAA